MTLTRREKIMIVAGIVVVTLAAYIFYFIIPYTNNMSAARKKLDDAQAQINLLNTKKAMVTKLKDEIAELDGQLNTADTAMPEGIDNAGILLYLKDLTDGRAVEMAVALPKEPELSDNFLTQDATLDFRTDYPGFVNIIDALKENKLYNRVTYLKVDYSPPAAQDSPQDGSAAPAFTAPPDRNVLQVHAELSFYALPNPDGSQMPQPLAPTNAERTEDLFPDR